MSLLLLYNGFPVAPVTTFACWAVVGSPTDSFVVANGLLDTWYYWSTYTWAQIQGSNRTWEYMAGNWFATSSTGTSGWSLVVEGSCPRI
jgi:hypothetical protein